MPDHKLLLDFIGAPLLVAPLPLWGWRLLMGRRLGLSAGRLIPGFLALLTAPGFFNAFPVTESWPLPLGLGGVVGEFWGHLFASALGITSGTILGLFGGILGVVALGCLVRAVAAPRAPARVEELGFQIRRRPQVRDEYGLDDTDAFESEPSTFSAYRGAAAHAILTLRAKMRRKPAHERREEPRLSDALARAMEDELEGPAVYRARGGEAPARPMRETAHELGEARPRSAPAHDPHDFDHEEDDEPVAVARPRPAPARARPAPAAAAPEPIEAAYAPDPRA